jgi:hypothetical protein
MAALVLGTFEDRAVAQAAIERLKAAGIAEGEISLLARDLEVEVPVAVEGTPATATVTGAAAGGLLGALGGVLIGLATLAVPGVGPVVAAGPLLAALSATAFGAAAGGMVGALVDMGVPEEHVRLYVSDVKRGHVLLAVRTDALSEARLRDLMAEAGALNLYPTAPADTLAV